MRMPILALLGCSLLPYLFIYGQAATPKRDYKNVMMAEMSDDGIHFALTKFKAQDGARLDVIHGNCGTVTKAEAYFVKRLSQASKVLSQESIRDKKGVIVGKHAEVSFVPDKANEVGYGILWTNGQDFSEIIAVSLEDARKVERANTK
jgi:hypothetical protein